MLNLKPTNYQGDTFFEELLSRFEYNNIEKIIVVGHLVPNSESYFLSLNKKIPILIIPKQNSINKIVEHNLSKEIAILKFNRADIQNHPKEFLNRLSDFIGTSTFAMIDIGGVFISVIEQLYIKFGNQIKGIVEDTENGHQKYEQILKDRLFPFPIFSVARSVLKEPEDFLIGESIVFSAEAILRKNGTIFNGKKAVVFGYGKIGSSIAHHLRTQGVVVRVIDTNPNRQLLALCHHFYAGKREEILSTSDLLFCATGNKALNKNDISIIKEGAVIFTATSADDEIGDYRQFMDKVIPNSNEYLSKICVENSCFYLANQGRAINFLHGSVVGDFIKAVQAELLFAISLMNSIAEDDNIVEVTNEEKKFIAGLWMEYFTVR